MGHGYVGCVVDVLHLEADRVGVDDRHRHDKARGRGPRTYVDYRLDGIRQHNPILHRAETVLAGPARAEGGNAREDRTGEGLVALVGQLSGDRAGQRPGGDVAGRECRSQVEVRPSTDRRDDRNVRVVRDVQGADGPTFRF